MFKAIVTTYHGPTNSRGSRISAKDSDNNRVSISSPLELSGEEGHKLAAEALKKKMGWHGQLVGGHLKAGSFVVDGYPDAKRIESRKPRALSARDNSK